MFILRAYLLILRVVSELKFKGLFFLEVGISSHI